MLLGAGILAWAHPGVWGWPAVVLVVLFFLAFGVQEPLRALASGRRGPWGRWVAAYGVLLIAGAAFLVVEHGLYVMVPAAVLGVLLTGVDLLARRRGAHRAMGFRLAGGAALTLVLPGTLCILHPRWTAYAFALWALMVAYFVTRLVLVRARIAARNRSGAARTWRRAAVWVQVPVYACLLALVAFQQASPWVVAAFVPGTITALLPVREVSLRRTGWIEVGVLAWFVLGVILSYHLGDFRPPA